VRGACHAQQTRRPPVPANIFGLWRHSGRLRGSTVGSLLGTLTAAPERRHLLSAGDGSFQLTAQQLSTMLRH